MTLKRVALAWASVNAQGGITLGGSSGTNSLLGGSRNPGNGGSSSTNFGGSSGINSFLGGSRNPVIGGSSSTNFGGSSGINSLLGGSRNPGNGGSSSTNFGGSSGINSLLGGSRNPVIGGSSGGNTVGSSGTNNFNPARNPTSRETTTEATVTEDSSVGSTDLQEPTDSTTVINNDDVESPQTAMPTTPEWEIKGGNPDERREEWGSTGDTEGDWSHVTSGDTSGDGMNLGDYGRPNNDGSDRYGRENLKSVGMMDPKNKEMEMTYQMHEKEMKSKKKYMTAVEKSIADIEDKMMMQAFEFGFGFVLHNMDVIMKQIEPVVLRFNSMLESVLSLTTIEEGNLAAHPMVSLIRERTTDIVNATSHLFYYMEGENDYGAQDFVNTMMDICTELRNRTNEYETFPMMKMIVDMLPGGYDASRESSSQFILSVAEHYKMWFKWENLYEEMMGSYKKMDSMKDKMYGGDDFGEYGYDGEYGYNHDGHHEMKETYPPMPNTPLGQLFMGNMEDQQGQYGDGNRRPAKNRKRPVMEMVQSAMSMMDNNDTENTIFKVVEELMEMFDGIDMQSILPMVTRMVQNNVNMDFSKILEMAQMFM